MLSRIADSLFWLNRYMERNDGLLRAIKTNYILSLENIPSAGQIWKPVLLTFTNSSNNQRDDIVRNPASVLDHLVLDTENANSVKVMITKARENARGIQDHLTKEVWEHVNQLYHFINSPLLKKQLNSNEAINALDSMLQKSLLYNGVVDATMPRSLGWSFLNLGKYIERCLLSIELADKYFAEVNYDLKNDRDILYWRHLLLSLSGYELHLKYFQNSSHSKNVAEQVLFNSSFPRSVNYSLKHVNKYLRNAIAENNSEENNEVTRQFGRLYSLVKYADLAQINEIGLQNYLNLIRSGLISFNKLLGETFFLLY